MTDGRKSLDSVMRLAYERYGHERGFTPDEFRRTAEDVANGDWREWFRQSVSSTEELDYTDVLDWFGLRFIESGGTIAGNWALAVRSDQTDAQRRNMTLWLERSGR